MLAARNKQVSAGYRVHRLVCETGTWPPARWGGVGKTVLTSPAGKTRWPSDHASWRAKRRWWHSGSGRVFWPQGQYTQLYSYPGPLCSGPCR